jgi:hypothetical protein
MSWNTSDSVGLRRPFTMSYALLRGMRDRGGRGARVDRSAAGAATASIPHNLIVSPTQRAHVIDTSCSPSTCMAASIWPSPPPHPHTAPPPQPPGLSRDRHQLQPQRFLGRLHDLVGVLQAAHKAAVAAERRAVGTRPIDAARLCNGRLDGVVGQEGVTVGPRGPGAWVAGARGDRGAQPPAPRLRPPAPSQTPTPSLPALAHLQMVQHLEQQPPGAHLRTKQAAAARRQPEAAEPPAESGLLARCVRVVLVGVLVGVIPQLPRAAWVAVWGLGVWR